MFVILLVGREVNWVIVGTSSLRSHVYKGTKRKETYGIFFSFQFIA